MERIFFLILLLTSAAHGSTGKPKLRFTLSYSGPAGSTLQTPQTVFQPHRSADLGTLYGLMALSPEARRDSLGGFCEGLSLERKMQLGASLGLLLSGIYDDARAGNGPRSGDRVTVEDQWSALRQRYLDHDSTAVSGVCRDSASTLAAFFRDCGIPEDSITIDSYVSTRGGHQIVSVQGPDGKLYSVNWSELTLQEADGTNQPLLAHPQSLYDQGIQQIRYNARGQVIGRRDTSLGALLKQATQGAPDDPLYNPALLRLEAEFGHGRGSAFQGQLRDGHRVQGGTLGFSANFGKKSGAEIAAAQALRTGPLGFESHITYGRFRFYSRRDVSLGAGWTLSPLIQFEGEGALLRLDGQTSPDGAARMTPGLSLEKRFASGASAYLEALPRIGVDPYNNNQADRLEPTLFRERILITGGLVLSDRTDLAVQHRSDVWNQSTTLWIRQAGKSLKWQAEQGLSIYRIPGQKPLPVWTSGLERKYERKTSALLVRAQAQVFPRGPPSVSITLIGTPLKRYHPMR